MEMVLYKTCKRLIESGNTEGLAGKLDVFWAASKLTDAHYNELTAMLTAE